MKNKQCDVVTKAAMYCVDMIQNCDIDFSAMKSEDKPYPGSLIVLEGVDGAGKTTHALRLVDHLNSKGLASRYVRTPGGTELGEKIRDIVLYHTGPIDDLTEMFLFQAQLSACIRDVIRPALDSGEVVVCDRLIFSTMAYQGAGRQMDLDMLHTMQKVSLQGVWPDFGFLMYSDKVKESDGSRMEDEAPSFLARVHAMYKMLPTFNPTVCDMMTTITLQETEEETFNLIKDSTYVSLSRIHEARERSMLKQKGFEC